MSTVEYKRTLVEHSELRFDFKTKTPDFSGPCKVVATVRTPKMPQKGETVLCITELTVGGENEAVYIHLKAIHHFVISAEEIGENFRKDTASFCNQIALEKLSDILKQLSKIHTGREISLPLADIQDT